MDQRAPIEEVVKLLEAVGIQVVSIEPDKAVVAFRDDGNLDAFYTAVQEYQNGPRLNARGERYKSTKWDILQFIEPDGMRGWTRKDRIGDRLSKEIGADGQSIEAARLYRVDVELWHPGTTAAADALLAELRQVVVGQDPTERVTDSFRGNAVCLARAFVGGSKLSGLLDLDAVAEIEAPPKPILDPTEVARVTPRDFPAIIPPRPDGPRVCVLDSGVVSNHQMIAQHIGHAESVLTRQGTTADLHGHGMMVSGVAVFGDVKDPRLSLLTF